MRMESPVESPLSNCLVEMIIMKQYLGHEEDWDRVRVKRADLLYEDYSSKFDSCNQLRNSSMCCSKYFLIFPKHRQPSFHHSVSQYAWVKTLNISEVILWERDNLSGRAHAQYVCVRLCLCTTFHPQAYSQSHFGRVMAQTWLKLPFISRRTTLKRGYFGWKYYALIRKARVLYQVIYVKEKV